MAQNQATHLKPKDMETMFKIKDYLENHYSESITLGGLSRKFAINEFKLKQLFRQVFGQPVITFLTEIRLQSAGHLLKETTSSIEDIAGRVGYRHAGNFSVAFKRRFLESPGKWRFKKI